MSEQPLRCPEEACTGWVSEVDDDDEHFWGCGECGSTWEKRRKLDDAIREAIGKYPYRKKCYRKSKQSWKPVPLEKEPENYEELVEQEESGDAEPAEENFACPVSKCDGTALYMEDESEYGGDPAHWLCDCCDSKWFKKKNLMKEISEIIKEYPYRAKMYRKAGREWAPVEWDGDIMDYVELVEKEARDRTAGRKRG